MHYRSSSSICILLLHAVSQPLPAKSLLMLPPPPTSKGTHFIKLDGSNIFCHYFPSAILDGHHSVEWYTVGIYALWLKASSQQGSCSISSLLACGLAVASWLRSWLHILSFSVVSAKWKLLSSLRRTLLLSSGNFCSSCYNFFWKLLGVQWQHFNELLPAQKSYG